MHGKHSHKLCYGLLLAYILFMIEACSAASTPAPSVQASTPTSRETTPTIRTSPTPSTSSTALITYTGHTQAILSLAWSPDGKYIASGSNDTTVQVWVTATGKRLLIYHGHKTGVTTISW